MTVFFSQPMSCWAWTCIWGCGGFDYEGEQEATEAAMAHRCLGKP